MVNIKPGPANWRLVYRALCAKVKGLVPADVGRMCLGEIAMILEDDKAASGHMSDAEILAHLDRRKKMTHLEKLRNFERD